jgi:hypothetical protein
MPQEVFDRQYMYCFFRGTSPETFKTKGMGERGDPVVTMIYRDLVAVVSNSPESEYDSSRRNMMNHTKVLEEVMETHSILPVRFDTISPDKEKVCELLEERYDELISELERMDGKVEMGLKALWYEGIVFDEIVTQRADIRQLRDSLQGKSPDKTYYERIKLGELVEAAVKQKRADDQEAILNCLRPFAVETKMNDTFGERMIVNAAFLVRRSDEAGMDAAIQALDQEMTQRVLFRYVGPVPPYNFVSLVIRWKK